MPQPPAVPAWRSEIHYVSRRADPGDLAQSRPPSPSRRCVCRRPGCCRVRRASATSFTLGHHRRGRSLSKSETAASTILRDRAAAGLDRQRSLTRPQARTPRARPPGLVGGGRAARVPRARARSRRTVPRTACAAGCRHCRAAPRRRRRAAAERSGPRAARCRSRSGAPASSATIPAPADRVTRIGPLGNRHQLESVPQLRRDILGRMHGHVDAAFEQRPFELSTPTATCRPQLRRGHPGRDRDDLGGVAAPGPVGDPLGLRLRERAPARPDPHQRRRRSAIDLTGASCSSIS